MTSAQVGDRVPPLSLTPTRGERMPSPSTGEGQDGGEGVELVGASLGEAHGLGEAILGRRTVQADQALLSQPFQDLRQPGEVLGLKIRA